MRDMKAIALNIGKLHGRTQMKILNCEDSGFIGAIYFTESEASSLPELITFSPEDQFCKVIKLMSIAIFKDVLDKHN